MSCNNNINIQSRRDFLAKTAMGFGALGLSSLINPVSAAGTDDVLKGVLGRPHFPAKAKRVIYLFQSGAPSHLELFDPKPLLEEMNGEELPD